METDPDTFTVGAVADWIERLRAYGPPDEGVQVWDDDELYLAQVSRTDVICRYFVIVHESLIIINRFDAG